MAKLQIMGVYEIAQRLGVSKSRVRQLARERGFPEPGARLAMGLVWATEDIEAWIAAHRPPPDEPEG